MPSHGSGIAGRVFGLDVMRATAGIMVLLSHTSHLVAEHWPRFPAVPSIDWVGVFFVLSGYLIGGLLLDTMDKPGSASLRFANFMQRRWLRTLPNYYLFLVLNIALVHFSLAPGLLTRATPAYFFFLQNLHMPLDLFYWESWSLAVEEWFYLLFPLLAFGATALIGLSGPRAFLWACVLFLGLPVAARYAVLPHVVDAGTMALWLDKLVITRLDAPGMGMLAVWVARRWPGPWRRLRWPAVVVGATLLVNMGALRHAASLGAAPWLNSLEAFSVALFLPFLANWKSGGPLNPVFAYLSLVTYALYLVHLPLLYVFGRLVPDPMAWRCALNYALFITAALLLATLVHRLWELPFMHQRDRLGRWLALHWPVHGAKDG